MQSKRLVIDANILIRAVLGIRAREIIERYCESAAFYVAEANFEEAVQYLAGLAPDAASARTYGGNRSAA